MAPRLDPWSEEGHATTRGTRPQGPALGAKARHKLAGGDLPAIGLRCVEGAAQQTVPAHRAEHFRPRDVASEEESASIGRSVRSPGRPDDLEGIRRQSQQRTSNVVEDAIASHCKASIWHPTASCDMRRDVVQLLVAERSHAKATNTSLPGRALVAGREAMGAADG